MDPLCGMMQSVYAQNLEIKGWIRDARNKDSDAKGCFYLEKVKGGDYLLVVSSLGYQPKYIALNGFFKSIAVGDILLEDASVALADVTAAASNQSSRSPRNRFQ